MEHKRNGMPKTLIHQATIVNDGKQFVASVLIDGDRIAKIYTQESDIEEFIFREAKVVDARGKYLLPGIIDSHVHFRDPGFVYKGDLVTESRAAIAGGITSFFDMPNTNPQTVTCQAWQEKMQLASEKSYANYAFHFGVTNDNFSEIEKLDFSKVCGLKVFLGSSTGNMLLDKSSVLEQLFSSVKSVISIHAESEPLIRANKEKYVAMYGEDLPIRYHSLIREEEVCYRSSAQAVELASKYGTRLHILHISTKKELSLFEDRPLEEKRITAETCPHYLWFDQDDYTRLGGAIKCNPAIKTSEDKAALRAAIGTHLLDTIGTDHAPHLWDEKQGTCLKALSGCPSIQFSLILMMELSRQGVLNLETVVEKMCHAPARLFHVVDRGYIKEGYYADLVLVCPDVEWTLKKSDILSKCGWSPYESETFHTRVEQTYVNGHLVYNNGIFEEHKVAKSLLFK